MGRLVLLACVVLAVWVVSRLWRSEGSSLETPSRVHALVPRSPHVDTVPPREVVEPTDAAGERTSPASAVTSTPAATVDQPSDVEIIEQIEHELDHFQQAAPDVDGLFQLLARIIDQAQLKSVPMQVDDKGTHWWHLPARPDGTRISFGKSEVEGGPAARLRIEPGLAMPRGMPFAARGSAIDAEFKLEAGAVRVSGMVANGVDPRPQAHEVLEQMGESTFGHRFVFSDEGRLKVMRCCLRPLSSENGVVMEFGSDSHAVDVPTYVQPGTAARLRERLLAKIAPLD